MTWLVSAYGRTSGRSLYKLKGWFVSMSALRGGSEAEPRVATGLKTRGSPGSAPPPSAAAPALDPLPLRFTLGDASRLDRQGPGLALGLGTSGDALRRDVLTSWGRAGFRTQGVAAEHCRAELGGAASSEQESCSSGRRCVLLHSEPGLVSGIRRSASWEGCGAEAAPEPSRGLPQSSVAPVTSGGVCVLAAMVPDSSAGDGFKMPFDPEPHPSASEPPPPTGSWGAGGVLVRLSARSTDRTVSVPISPSSPGAASTPSGPSALWDSSSSCGRGWEAPLLLDSAGGSAVLLLPESLLSAPPHPPPAFLRFTSLLSSSAFLLLFAMASLLITEGSFPSGLGPSLPICPCSEGTLLGWGSLVHTGEELRCCPGEFWEDWTWHVELELVRDLGLLACVRAE